jgi:hypothetical protein
MSNISNNNSNKYSAESIISDLSTNSLAECIFPPPGPKTNVGILF